MPDCASGFRSFAFVLVAVACSVLSLSAAVTSIDLIDQTAVLGGISFGKTGPYDCLTGKIHFAVDPKLGPNRIIADIDRAPQSSNGQVEFAADLFMLRPHNAGAGNGTALVEISNRGGKALLYEFNLANSHLDPQSSASFGDDFLLQQGFTLVWVGWEFDVPPTPGLLRSDLPIATDHGKAITGIVRSEWTGESRVDTIPLGDKGQIGYAVLDATSRSNRLFVRDSVEGERRPVPHSEWKFSDATHISLEGGFAPGRIFEAVYETKNPPVAGLGLAAVRDFVSYLKYSSPAGSWKRDSSIQRAIAFGVSQSGRFLREFIFDGFNEDEQHRQVFDGVWAHVAGAGRGSFNARFAQPSRDGHEFQNVFYPVNVPPFDEEQLLERSRRAHVLPKLFLTNGAYEYWGRCASLIHTTADGKADAPPSTDTRIYFFSGSQHTVGSIPPRPAPAQNATNVNDYRFALRALLLAMQSWLAEGRQPPPSTYPRLDLGQLTTPEHLNFPKIEGVAVPAHQRRAFRLDFSSEPPRESSPFPTFVPQVDLDGNDLGGIEMPEVAVPLASYTGWNLRKASIGAPTELLSFVGSWLPLSLTKDGGQVDHDTRPSIAARYHDKQAYLGAIDTAAKELARSGFLLQADLESIHRRAATEWEYRQSLK